MLGDPDALRIVRQPILDLRTGTIAGYEALARFRDGGPPDRWFADAHRFGLGAELEAVAIAQALGAPGRPEGTYLSINLGPSALVSQAVWNVLPERLDGIVVEITEHERIVSPEGVDSAIARLRHRGARLAVDDAGSGYAGLQRLMRLEPDVIKLDRALIDGVDSDRVKAALANAIVRFAESIGATVCAEGLETVEALTEVAELGIAFGQGYVIARPDGGWPAASPTAVGACRLSIEEALRPTGFDTQATDRRMASIASAASSIRTNEDAIATFDLIAREMNAEHVCVSAIIDDGRAVQTLLANESFDGGKIYPLATHPLTARVLESGDMVQVRVSDPDADVGELSWMEPEGYRGLIMAPIVSDARSIALLEICCRTERPWNRAEIYRARVICQLLAPAIARLCA